jgi:integrase
MAKFYYQLRDTNSTAPTPIILVATFKGLRIKCKTDLKILPKYWNIKDKTIIDLKDFTKETKDLIKEIDRISKKLSNLKIVAEDTFNYFEYITKSIPTWSEYSNLFYKKAGLEVEETANKPTPEPIKETLFTFIAKVIEQSKTRNNERTGKPISINTIKVFNQCLRLLTEFNKTVRKIDFENIDLDFYHDFKEFMLKKEYSPNTIAKHTITLKTFLNEATERGVNSNLAFKSKRFSAPQIEVKTIFLNDLELTALYDLDLSENLKLDRVRDLFLTGCYTGLRFSDFSQIKPQNIKGQNIEITTQKTNETVLIPIHPRVKAIMKKYEGKYANSLPPSIANQNMNIYLKELCTLVDCLNAEINKTSKKGNLTINETVKKYTLVTTHTARRSFATNLYLQGFPAINIMKLTGHKTEKSFLKYIKITPTDNAKRLELHWSNLNIDNTKTFKIV